MDGLDLAVSLNPNQVSPGLLGFLVVCVLGVLVWLLCRNMGKHLERMENEYKAEQAAAEIVEAIPAQVGPAGPTGPKVTGGKSGTSGKPGKVAPKA